MYLREIFYIFKFSVFPRFQEIGVWNSGVRVSLRRPLFPDLVNLYRNFEGRQLVLSSLDNWPFFELKYLENDTVVAERGIDVAIVNTLGYYLNFT